MTLFQDIGLRVMDINFDMMEDVVALAASS